MVVGAPLEDARHLAQRYDRVRQEAESQVTFGLTSQFPKSMVCVNLMHFVLPQSQCSPLILLIGMIEN